jgi:hypothetical protein
MQTEKTPRTWISVRLDREVAQALEREAAESSKSAVIREVIRLGLERLAIGRPSSATAGFSHDTTG